jgi:ABC-type transport system involved in multi-copper enzyme maturation permease subunit
MTETAEAETASDSVGPFTGFGNFLRKELRDWWYSWRLILVFAVPTLFQTMTVFFGFSRIQDRFSRLIGDAPEMLESIATVVLLQPFSSQNPVLFIIITIFSTMGLLTTEKSTGTLAWNLTKPLGRTAVLVSKWLIATLVLWLAMCVMPVVVSSISLIAYKGITPQFERMLPVLGIAVFWVALWVLLILTISLAFESQSAVGGIGIAFWIVPFLFSALLGEVFGQQTRDWLLDRLGTRSPFWAYPLTLHKDLNFMNKVEEPKDVWIYAYFVWMFVLGFFSIRIFNRQEIGS